MQFLGGQRSDGREPGFDVRLQVGDEALKAVVDLENRLRDLVFVAVRGGLIVFVEGCDVKVGQLFQVSEDRANVA